MIWRTALVRLASGLVASVILFSSRTYSAQAEAAKPNAEADIDAKVASIVADWEALPSVFDDVEIYAAQVQELVKTGETAVPGLIAALDRTSRDTPLRLIPFTLRAIGDPRAVPALIRAIPKTLRPPGSDCGILVQDRDLLHFMLTHDLDETKGDARFRRRNFDMGRPVREVAATLRKITGTNQNETEIFHTFLEGGEQQRALQKRAFSAVAQRWADWWKVNWHQFVTDPAFAEVRLSAPSEELSLKRFATGQNMKVTSGMEGMVITPVEKRGNFSCLGLGLSRSVQLFDGKSETNLNESLVDLAARAARAGGDLIGTQYRDPKLGKLYYTARGVGLQAWQIGNEHWARIEEELQRGALPALDAPAGDFLMYYDRAEGRYHPQKKATFLFITRDGLQGILRVTAQVTRLFSPRDLGMPAIRTDETGPDQTEDASSEFGVKVDYKFFYEETEQLRAAEQARLAERATRDETRYQRKMAALMKKHPPLGGSVYLPDGKLAPGAAVLLAVRGEAAILGDRRFEMTNSSTMTHTLADGSFVLPRVPTAPMLYVVHDEGFSEINLDETETPLKIRLQPWGRIEGTAVIGGKPAPRQKIAILTDFESFEMQRLSLSPGTFKTESDEAGRFVISNVPPVEVQVYRMIENTYYEGQTVQVKSGETTHVRKGFDGRTIKGRLVTSDASQASWRSRAFTFATKYSPPEPPPGVDGRTWLDTYWRSAEGKERKRNSHNFPVVLESNGEFRIQDVPPGTYELRGELREGAANTLFPTGPALGRLKQEIVVQPGPENEAMDVGELIVQMVKILKAGDVAPEFEVKTVEGGVLRLSDFRGKYVLLDFWATWCGPCREEIPNLKEVFERYHAQPKFAMLGLSLDPKVDAPKDYAKKEGLRWHQGFLGDWSKATLPAQYGVEGIPATFLIDPEGKIAAKELRGEEIGDTLEVLLEK